MLPTARKAKILELLSRKKSIEVTTLSKILNISEVTVRRDLEQLNDRGLLKRTHGGATSLESTDFELSYQVQLERHKEEKERIAQAASRYVADGDTIILDASTTVLQIIKNLQGKRELTVVTNAIDNILKLAGNGDFTLVSTGGMLRKKSMALVGPIAGKTLGDFCAHKLFMGISALTLEQGITTVSPLEAEVKRAMVKSAREVIGVTDSSKFGEINSSLVGPVTIMHRLITDDKISDEDLTGLKERGVEVIVV